MLRLVTLAREGGDYPQSWQTPRRSGTALTPGNQISARFCRDFISTAFGDSPDASADLFVGCRRSVSRSALKHVSADEEDRRHGRHNFGAGWHNVHAALAPCRPRHHAPVQRHGACRRHDRDPRGPHSAAAAAASRSSLAVSITFSLVHSVRKTSVLAQLKIHPPARLKTIASICDNCLLIGESRYRPPVRKREFVIPANGLRANPSGIEDAAKPIRPTLVVTTVQGSVKPRFQGKRLRLAVEVRQVSSAAGPTFHACPE